MIAPDTQLLLYAYDIRSRQHAAAVAYLEDILSGQELVGLPLPCLHAYVRLVTNPIISGRRISVQDAWGDVASWLALSHVRILYPGERHWDILKQVALEADARANLFPDAVIASIVMEHGAVLHTYDRDFARFAGLRWLNPLAQPGWKTGRA